MMKSAFGIDHGEFAKAYSKYGTEKKPSAGRRTTAALAPGLHPLIAGKKGKKGRAWGNVATRGVGGSIAGSAVGAGAGALATRNPVGIAAGGALGSFSGLHAGVQRGVTVNQRKGYYKKES